MYRARYIVSSLSAYVHTLASMHTRHISSSSELAHTHTLGRIHTIKYIAIMENRTHASSGARRRFLLGFEFTRRCRRRRRHTVCYCTFRVAHYIMRGEFRKCCIRTEHRQRPQCDCRSILARTIFAVTIYGAAHAEKHTHAEHSRAARV